MYIYIYIYILDPGWASLLKGFCYWIFGYPELFINYPKHLRTIYKLSPEHARTIYRLLKGLLKGSPKNRSFIPSMKSCDISHQYLQGFH